MIQYFLFNELELKGAYIIDPFIAYDQRGSFVKDYEKQVFMEHGIEHDLKEVFYTSSKRGVLRGLHFQRVKEQPKLVRCLYGQVYDVIVDLRKDSKTFGQWKAHILDDKNNKMLYIPKQFGHGYIALKESIVSYKCSVKFYEEYDDGIAYDDKDLAIDWRLDLIDNQIILSEKDKNLQSFNDFIDKLY